MEEETTTSIWNKKPDELSVGDNLKITAGVLVVMTVAPAAIIGVAAGAAHLYDKFQERRAAKKTLTIVPEQ